MADTLDHILNESIDTPEFYETVSSWKENSPNAALWSDVIDKINEYAKREVASALASRPAEVDDERKHPCTPEEMRDFIGNNYCSMQDGFAATTGIVYTLTIHDLLSSMSNWFEDE